MLPTKCLTITPQRAETAHPQRGEATRQGARRHAGTRRRGKHEATSPPENRGERKGTGQPVKRRVRGDRHDSDHTPSARGDRDKALVTPPPYPTEGAGSDTPTPTPDEREGAPLPRERRREVPRVVSAIPPTPYPHPTPEGDTLSPEGERGKRKVPRVVANTPPPCTVLHPLSRVVAMSISQPSCLECDDKWSQCRCKPYPFI